METTPAIPAHVPDIIKTIRVCSFTSIPENHAACLFPPRAYIFLPNFVFVVRNPKIRAITTAIIAGTGIPKILPAIIFVNKGLNPKTGLASDIIRVIPLKIACVPKVIIKGCNSVTLTKNPFNSPINAPARIPPISIANTGFIPATNSFPVNIPVRAITEPTDKSIPAISIAKNSPQAISIFTELCSIICVILSNEKNSAGCPIPKTTITIIKMPKVPYFCHNVLNSDFIFPLLH